MKQKHPRHLGHNDQLQSICDDAFTVILNAAAVTTMRRKSLSWLRHGLVPHSQELCATGPEPDIASRPMLSMICSNAYAM